MECVHFRIRPVLWVTAWGYTERPNKAPWEWPELTEGAGISSASRWAVCTGRGEPAPQRVPAVLLGYRSPAAGKPGLLSVNWGLVDSVVCLQAACIHPALRGRAEADLAPWPFGNLLWEHRLLCQFLPGTGTCQSRLLSPGACCPWPPPLPNRPVTKRQSHPFPHLPSCDTSFQGAREGGGTCARMSEDLSPG